MDYSCEYIPIISKNWKYENLWFAIIIYFRISFHSVWDNIARVSGHVQKILRSNFSNFSSKNNLTDETTGKTMYG
jgi:hypothetical protein